MSEEAHPGYRERARVAGRAVLATGFASAVFLLWLGLGLNSVPGFQFGGPAAQADDGVVVQLAHRPGAAFVPKPVVVRATVRRHRPATAVASKSAPVQRRVSAPLASRPRPAPTTPTVGPPSPQAPTGGTPAPAPAVPVAGGSTPPVSTPTVPVQVGLPPLPVQVPAAPVPQVVPSLPPLPPPVTTVVSNLTPPGLP